MEISPCRTACLICQDNNGLIFCNYSRFHKICLACSEITNLDNLFKCQICSVEVKVVSISIWEQKQNLCNSAPDLQIIPTKNSGNTINSYYSEIQTPIYNLSPPNLFPYQEYKNPEYPIETMIEKVETSLEFNSVSYEFEFYENKQSEPTSLKQNNNLSLSNEFGLTSNYEETKINEYNPLNYQGYSTVNVISTETKPYNIPEEKKTFINEKMSEDETCPNCRIKLNDEKICNMCKIKKCDSCKEFKNFNKIKGFCNHYLCEMCSDKKCCCICDPNSTCKGCKKPCIYLKNLCNHNICENCRKTIKLCLLCKCIDCEKVSSNLETKICGHQVCEECNNKVFASCKKCKNFLFKCKEHNKTFFLDDLEKKKGKIYFTCCNKHICINCRLSNNCRCKMNEIEKIVKNDKGKEVKNIKGKVAKNVKGINNKLK